MAKKKFSPANSIAALLGLWLCSCNLPDRTNSPTDSENKTAQQGVYESANEKRGLVLVNESALTLPPAKVSVLLKIIDDQNNAVTALCRKDFILAEDSAKISVYESSYRVQNRPENYRVSVLLLLDLSGSVIDSNLVTLKNATRDFIRALFRDEAGANLSLSIYWFDGGEHINSLVEFSADSSQLQRAVDTVSARLTRDRSTNLNGAVIEGVERIKAETLKLKAPFVSHGALVLFTDGADRAARKTARQAESAVNANRATISAYAIGLGEEIDKERLEALGPDKFEYAPTGNEMKEKFARTAKSILNNIRARYLVEYCSPKRSGRHKLTVAVFDSTAHMRYGAITVSFPADDFEGGCTLTGGCSQ